jgi:hypothetical protein
MSLAYLDTSWLVAVVLGEAGHERLERELARMDSVHAANLVEAEFRATLSREQIPFRTELLDGIGWVIPDRPLREEITRVLDRGHVRGADLWHLACALYLSPDPGELDYLTVDRRQGEIAAALGFRTTLPEVEAPDDDAADSGEPDQEPDGPS